MSTLPMTGHPRGPEPGERGSAERGENAARDPAREILRRLAQGSRGFDRFGIEGRVGEGGMGIVLRVHDPELNRTLALKRMKSPRRGDAVAEETPESARRIARFLDEAQVTGQLDHPGIIPVHELGLDPEGQPYFTMKLVRGKTLQEVLPLAREGSEGWSTTRVVGVLLRICEAMSYAHAHGVVHRDLKPSNVMLGRFGEVYVMDWGLARVFGASEGASATEFLDWRHSGSPGSSPLITEEGEVFGTPAYMSPEQALGDSDAVGPQTDVYAVGAILYEVLCGTAPFTSKSSPVDNRQVLARLRSGPPIPIEEVARSAPPELVAICRRAMERVQESRYDSMGHLADDLRAYLELRVVRAYRTGPLVEFRKWVARNRAVAALSLSGLGLLAISGFVLARVQSKRAAEVAADVWELGALDLVADAAALPSLRSEALPVWDAWLRDARATVERRASYERELDRFLDANAGSTRIADPAAAARRPNDDVLRDLTTRFDKYPEYLAKLEVSAPGKAAPTHAANDAQVLRLELADLPRRIHAERARIAAWRGWRFTDDMLAARHERLEAVCGALRALDDPVDGRIAWVAGTLAAARSAVEDHREEWSRTQREIADALTCPAYGGLVVPPQLGLVPLGKNPESGLHEFWHTLSGERPLRGPDGRWVIRPSTGIVLVLVPGGTTTIGAQQTNPNGPNYVPLVDGKESELRGFEHAPVSIALIPYLLSRYEVTQAQWLRLTGSNPSDQFAGTSRSWRRTDGSRLPLPRWSRSHPVESITWRECRSNLALWALDLPTETQWEHAARAGRGTPYWSGDSFSTLRDFVNWYDPLTSQANLGRAVTDDELAEATDRWPMAAPVDAFPPNRWGFHSISGNVEEWCRDPFGEPCDGADRRPGTGENRPPAWSGRAVRGGSYRSQPGELRVTRRYGPPESTGDPTRGVRPICNLDLDTKGDRT